MFTFPYPLNDGVSILNAVDILTYYIETASISTTPHPTLKSPKQNKK